MEKSIEQDLFSCMQETFSLKEVDIREYSPLTLAYIGDSIYDLIIKTIVINEGNKQVQKLHKETSALVQASAQSKMMRTLQGVLTQEELAVYKRGRKFPSQFPRQKNQSVTDYRRATGFEALMGYLYLEKNWTRMVELIRLGLESLNTEENKDE